VEKRQFKQSKAKNIKKQRHSKYSTPYKFSTYYTTVLQRKPQGRIGLDFLFYFFLKEDFRQRPAKASAQEQTQDTRQRHIYTGISTGIGTAGIGTAGIGTAGIGTAGIGTGIGIRIGSGTGLHSQPPCLQLLCIKS
jgi:hypothetical protein